MKYHVCVIVSHRCDLTLLYVCKFLKVSGLYQSNISRICTKCCLYLTNTSPIYHQNEGHISVIKIWGKLDLPSHLKSCAFRIMDYLIFNAPSSFGLFLWMAPLRELVLEDCCQHCEVSPIRLIGKSYQ